MNLTHRFPAGLIRWTSLFVSLALVSSFLFPYLSTSANNSVNRNLRDLQFKQQSTSSDALMTRVIASQNNNQNRGMPSFPPSPARKQPQPPPTKAERETRVFRIKLSVGGEQWIASGERIAIGAVPVDRDGDPINGLRVEWSTSDKQTVFVTTQGDAIAGEPGSAHLTARAGNKQEVIKINVFDGGPERRKSSASAKVLSKRNLIARVRPGSMLAHAMSPAPPDDRLPDAETETLYQPINKVGTPQGKTEVAAKASAANDAVETPGSVNYTFSLPIESRAGRQLDAGLALTYNSRVWHKVVSGSTTKVYFDVDYGWPAPGFRLGYGQIEYQGSAGFTLTEPNGTRRKMVSIGGGNYRTNDGSIITYAGSQYGGTVTYPDGTRVVYGATSGPRNYPTRITDHNGNYIDISYLNNAGPKIFTITDTLSRYITFHYSGEDLIAVTAPGYDNGAARQVVRFYYETIQLPSSGMFHPNVQVTCPTSARVLRYVYLPGTQSGYRYDYSAYGMIRTSYQLRSMTVNTTSLTSMGWVESEGAVAASSQYNYPVSFTNDLTDAPKYTTRTDDWAGRTTASPPVWTYAFDAEEGMTTVTGPDNTVIETLANNSDGQVYMVNTKYQGTLLSRVFYQWYYSSVGPRLERIDATNDANQIRATTFSYDPNTIFNNVSVVSERDFAPFGTVGAELRRTETTYENSTNYTNRGLIHLPKTMKVFAGGSNTASSHVVYNYDGVTRADCPGIIMHDLAYNPYAGNVTSVTIYADAANTTGAQTNTLSYDIAGNVIEQTVSCCRRKSYTYSSSYDFAYATSESRGDVGQLSTSATFDFNTGLVREVMDENNQTSTIHYFPENLRYYMTVYPDTGYSAINYNDALFADPDAAHMHSLTMTTVATGVGTVIHGYDFYDGRGALVRHFDHYTAADGGNATRDVEYDDLGRARRVSNPYYSTNGTSSPINPDGFWTSNTFDGLGRITQVTMPRGDDNNQLTTSVQTVYAGTITTAIDQTGKQRRQLSDALGRVIRLDEPDANGNLGDPGAPNQPTVYEYDPLDNLIHITQGSQQRFFKYDSLSRLTHERQVEQDAPWTTNDFVAGNNQWSRKIIYNSQNLAQDAYDARQLRTQFVYDGLNRVKEVHYFGASGSPDPATPDAYYYYDSQALPPGAPSFDRGYSAGQLVAMTYGSANSTTGNYYGYDQMGRVLRHRQVTGATTYALSYTYSLAGQLLSETYPSNRTLSYGYDEAGRLAQVSEGATIYANNFAYQPDGSLSAETFGNGMVHSLSYNRRFQASEVKLKQSASGAELQRYNYSYGQVNQTDGAIDTSKNNGQIGRIDGYVNGAKQWDQRMIYDSLGRLATAAEYRGDNGSQSWQAHYDYDRYGNRFQYQSNSNLSYMSVQAGDIDAARNRFVPNGGPATTYDPAGNILSDAKFRGMNYQYDANGRQTFAERTDHISQQTAIYDGGGQRVQTVASGMTRRLVYDIFGQNIADYANGALESENIYRGGQLLAVWDAGTTSPVNLALNRAATQSTDPGWGGPASKAVDGNTSGNWLDGSVTHTNYDNQAWWQVDLGATQWVQSVELWNRTDCCPERLLNFNVILLDSSQSVVSTVNVSGNGGTPSTLQISGTARYVKVQLVGTNYLSLAEVKVWGMAAPANLALNKTATQSTDPGWGGPASKAVDGNTDGNWLNGSVTHTNYDNQAWWQVDLGSLQWVQNVELWNRTDCCPERLSNFNVILLDASQTVVSSVNVPGNGGTPSTVQINGTARYVKVQLVGTNYLSLAEVRVMGQTGGSGTLRYVLSDLQGSTRAVMNNNGVGTSTVVARHDYLPFGEEIGSSVGLRTTGQGYGAADTNRWKYGMLERDSASGLDHTWWRKYESGAGRWTSPDPLTSAGPQGLNAYSYAGNDPVNFIDPAGLIRAPGGCGYWDEAGWHGMACPIDDDFWGKFVRNSRFGGYSQDRFTEARNILLERLNKPDCAKVFGGLPKALKALNESKFKFKALGGPIKAGGSQLYRADSATTKGQTITINTQGKFYMENLSLPFTNSAGRTDPGVLDLSEFSYGTPGEHVNIGVDVVAAAFILAHELGHRTGIYGKDDKDGGKPDRTARNNKKIYDACFKD